jgi:hypothetical protein
LLTLGRPRLAIAMRRHLAVGRRAQRKTGATLK